MASFRGPYGPPPPPFGPALPFPGPLNGGPFGGPPLPFPGPPNGGPFGGDPFPGPPSRGPYHGGPFGDPLQNPYGNMIWDSCGPPCFGEPSEDTYDRPDYQTNPVYTRVTNITPSLFMTNKTGALNEMVLYNLQIDCVICAAESHEVQCPMYHYCDFRRIPVPKDPSGPNIIQYFDEVADLIHAVDSKGGRTLVVSLNGVSRGPTLVIAYLMKYMDLPLNKAYGVVCGQRPCIKPYPKFWKQLIKYEKELRGENTVVM